MSRRRVILLGIILGCVAIMILSVMGVWKEPPKPPSGDGSTPAPTKETENPDKGVTRITDLRFPEVDSNGKKKYVVQAEEAIEIMGMKNAPLKMKNTVIEVFDVPGNVKKTDPHTMKIRARSGSWDRTTKDAQLQDNVVVEVDPNTTITTEEVSWVPREDRVFTDCPVRLDGKDIKITGTGLDGSVTTQDVRIRKDVKVLISGTKGFSLAKKDDPAKKPKEPDKSAKPEAAGAPETPLTITCANDLLFAHPQRRATFHKDVKAVRGASWLNADTLDLTFNKGGDAVEKVVASGKVRFSDKDISGAADQVTWDAGSETATLTSNGESEIHQGPNSLKAKTIRLFKVEEKMHADCAGQLRVVSKGALKPGPAPKQSPSDKAPKTIDVFWEKDMLYRANEAVFQGNVKVVEQDGMRLSAEWLRVAFDKDRSKVKSILATGNVVLNDQGRNAYGDRMEWDALEGVGVLTSDKTVKVEEADNLIIAKTLRFSQTDDKVTADGAGYLVGSKAKKDGQAGESIHVIWEEGMSFDRKTHKALFHKNVEATRDKTKMWSQELNVFFDDNNKQVQKIIAKRDVRIEEGNQMGKGQEATYDAVTEEAVLVGAAGDPAEIVQDGGKSIQAPIVHMSRKTNSIRTDGGGVLVFQMKEEQGKQEDVTVTWKGPMEFDTVKHRAVFRDDVHARRGERKIDSEVLEVFFDDKNREVQNIVSTGNVRLVEGNRNGEGDKFVWNSAEGVIELEGKPEAVMRSEEGFFIKSPIIRQYQKDNTMEAQGRGVLEFTNLQKRPEGEKKMGQKIRVRWRDRLLFPRSEGKAVFYGQVVVTSETRRLEAGRLEIFLDQKEEPREMRAYDNVVVSDTQAGGNAKVAEGVGDKLVWTAQDDAAVLTGEGGANLYNAGQRLASGAEWNFKGFFAGENGEQRVTATKGQGPIVICIPEGAAKP